MHNSNSPDNNHFDTSSNVIYIEFFNKKNFPQGEWLREPDYCEWTYNGFKCLAIRDMTLGTWRGFVGVTKLHPSYNKSLVDIFNDKWGLRVLIHGGISFAGKLPPKFKELNSKFWWFGFECTQDEDVIPLAQFEPNHPLYEEAKNIQSYKNILFVRKEIKELTEHISKVK